MIEKKVVEVKEVTEPEPKTPEELEKERLARIEEAPTSGEEAQEQLDAEVQDSDGELGGDSGSAGKGTTRPEQDADTLSGDEEGELPTPSTR